MSPVKPLSTRELAEDTAFLPKLQTAVSRGQATAQLARDFRSAGIKAAGGNGSSRGSEVPDPTGQAATKPEHDPAAQYEALHAAAWRQLMTAAERLVRVDRMINSHADHQDRVTHSRIPHCVNPHCGEPIILPDGQTPDSGRCQPCANYRRQHDRDAPKATVQARHRKRTERTPA